MFVFTSLIVIILIIIILYAYFGIYKINTSKSAIVLRDSIKGWTNDQEFTPKEKKKKRIAKSELKILENSKELKFSISFWIKIDNLPESAYQNIENNIGDINNNILKKDWVKIINRNSSPLLEFNPLSTSLRLSTQVRIIENNTEKTTKELYSLGHIPLQRWNHICISLEGRNFDYYLNGKLKWSFILKNVPYVIPGSLNIFDDKNIYGEISYMRIFSDVLDPVKVDFVYKNALGRNKSLFPFGKFFWRLIGGNNKKDWYPHPKNAMIDWYWLV